MEISGQLHALASLFPGSKTVVPDECEVGQSTKAVWTLCRKKVFCPYPEPNHYSVRYVKYKPHTDLQLLQNVRFLRSQYFDYDVAVMTACSTDELFTLDTNKQIFPNHGQVYISTKIKRALNVKLTYSIYSKSFSVW
jgi:hypothetical protein